MAEDDDEDTVEISEEMSEEKANKLEAAAAASWGVFLSGKGVCHVPRCGEGEAEGPIEVGLHFVKIRASNFSDYKELYLLRYSGTAVALAIPKPWYYYSTTTAAPGAARGSSPGSRGWPPPGTAASRPPSPGSGARRARAPPNRTRTS